MLALSLYMCKWEPFCSLSLQ